MLEGTYEAPEYKNGEWLHVGKPIDIKEYKFLDSDGYYKRLMPDGSMMVLDVDKNGKPNKHGYIGGKT